MIDHVTPALVLDAILCLAYRDLADDENFTEQWDSRTAATEAVCSGCQRNCASILLFTSLCSHRLAENNQDRVRQQVKRKRISQILERGKGNPRTMQERSVKNETRSQSRSCCE